MVSSNSRQALRAALLLCSLGLLLVQFHLSLSKASDWHAARGTSPNDVAHLMRNIGTPASNATHKTRPTEISRSETVQPDRTTSTALNLSTSRSPIHGQLSTNALVARASVTVANDSSSTLNQKPVVPDDGASNPPSCLCPLTCDLSPPSRRPCWDRIVEIRRGNRLGEIQSCMRAVEEGVCGDECHPTRCRTNATLAANSTATSTPSASPLSKRASPNKLVGLDWSRIQDKERPEVPFRRHDGVVIVTKVEGPSALSAAKQMFCLFHTAYNRHVNYNVVLFTTLPWTPSQVEELQAVMPSTNLTVALEGPTLEEQLASMSPEDRDYLYRRCRVPPNGTLTWDHFCSEQPYKKAYTVQLSYAWQAEFRAHRVWKTPELAPYRYMLWIDTDALCTKSWTRDPVQVAVDHDLAILFDNIPGDYADNLELKDKMRRAYNRTFCKLTLDTESGVLFPHACRNDFFRIQVIHGFFHITDLDFYRGDRSSRFLDVLVESRRFSREWDDQLAVTIPAAMDAPNRSWDMRWHGLNLSVFHNGIMDGKDKEHPVPDDRFTSFWDQSVSRTWSIAQEMCGALVKHDG